MRNNVVLGLLFYILVAAVSATIHFQPAETNLEWYQHLNIMKRFPCGVPQPRSIRVVNLLSDKLEPSESVIPHATVLHRCDSGSGCCGNQSEVCKMAEEEQVVLHFYIKDVFKEQKGHFRPYIVSNHTRCSCQSLTNDIK